MFFLEFSLYLMHNSLFVILFFLLFDCSLRIAMLKSIFHQFLLSQFLKILALFSFKLNLLACNYFHFVFTHHFGGYLDFVLFTVFYFLFLFRSTVGDHMWVLIFMIRFVLFIIILTFILMIMTYWTFLVVLQCAIFLWSRVGAIAHFIFNWSEYIYISWAISLRVFLHYIQIFIAAASFA